MTTSLIVNHCHSNIGTNHFKISTKMEIRISILSRGKSETSRVRTALVFHPYFTLLHLCFSHTAVRGLQGKQFLQPVTCPARILATFILPCPVNFSAYPALPCPGILLITFNLPCPALLCSI